MTGNRVQNIYKLSPLQQGMLFHALYAPGSDAYVVQFCATLRGNIDGAILREAWQRVTARHEMLRASFHWKEVEKPVQVIHASVELPWSEEDWRDVPVADRQHRFDAFREQEIRAGFALDRPPLMRLALIRTGDDVYRFVWTLHHLILDGWSLHVVLREVFTLVRALSDGRDVTLPPARPFGDYLKWLKRQDGADAAAFWRGMLGDFEQPTPLPLISKRDGDGSGRAEAERELDEGVTAAIERFARANEVTVNTVAAGAWSLALSLLTGERDVVFGSVVSGRPAEIGGVDAMVGLFINTLPVRVNAGAEVDVAGWLQSLQRTLTSVRKYEHSSLAGVQQASGVASGRALFDSIVVFENYPADEAMFRSLSGIDIGELSVSERTTYPLTLTIVPGRSMRLRLAFDGASYDADTAARLLRYVEHLLREMVGRPAASLRDLTLLSDDERRQILVDWNATERQYDGARCIHTLFEEQAARTPDALAVRHGDDALTFGELNARANRMAHFLIRSGVTTESLVGVALDRSPDMIVALLGILKAGGAYVPLDPGYPAERLAFMCDDAGVQIVLTNQRHQNAVPAGPRRVLVDRQWDEIAKGSAAEPNVPTNGDNVAYVVYTSGSTGRPKGVLGLHRGAVNRFRWMWERYPFAAGEVHAQKTSLNFLDSLWEIFGTLLQGVPVTIFDDATIKDPRRFVAALDRQGVTRLVLVPSLLRLLLDSDVPSPLLPKLKICVTSGEALPVELWQRFRERLPHALLLNLYGSSEISADATYEELRELPPDVDGVPIGRPIANTRAYILDRDLRPVPAGVTGELFVGGEGVARGYLNRPDLTSQRFLDDPFVPGGRLFRTGDLARWRSDGRIDYLGRADHQVKIRGFRVELGEIETTIVALEGVRHAVVVARDEPRGGRRLVAYVVADRELAATEIRDRVAAALPEYMVPSAVVFLDALPLTPSGKLDRNALPEPGRAVDRAYVAPRTETERTIAGIFAAVLGAENVGAEADFFALGGHSLLATQLVSRIRHSLGADLPVAKVFDARTVAELARLVDGARAAGVEVAPESPPDDRATLSFAQQRLWFLDQMDRGNPLYNVPTAVRIRGRIDYGALQLTVSEIVARHEALRTRIIEIDGGGKAVVADAEPLDVPVVDADTEDAALALARDEALRGFDLARETLFRAKLIRLAADDHLLAVTMHHIASDGWSIGIVLQEFAAIYDAFARGEASPLPPLPMQYGAFARWQRERMNDARTAEQLAYWKRQLEGAESLLDLPLDRPRPAVQTHRGAAETFLFSRELLDEIDAFSRAERATVFMTLLAALQTLLHRYSRQNDISVGTPVAGRTRVESEALIGFFINTLVLRTRFDDDPPFRELLARVRETALGAYAHQELPFERLVETLRPDRNLAQQPLFQVMFVLQNEPMKVVQPRTLEMKPVYVDTGLAKFDLTVQLTETESGLDGLIEYSTDLFDRETIVRFVRHFETLLQAIVRDPSRRVGELPLLGCDERHRVLAEWNDTARDYGEPRLLHRLIEEQVRRTPEAIAMSFGEQTLTYRDLNARANRLARRLRREGVGPDVLVAVVMERSIELVVALVAILKAGGAYVPVDPEYPSERVRFMLDDAGAKLVLTQARFESLAASSGATVLALDRDDDSIAHESEDDLDIDVSPDDLAYVIYTSGSTGTPKGAMNAHRGIVNRLRWMQEAFAIGERDVVAQKTPFSFDVSVWEFFWPLMTGARLAVAPPGVHRDSAALGEWIERESVTVIHFVPPMLETFLRHAPSVSESLRLVICSGEALSPALQDELFARSHAALHNLYGPTEAAIDVTHWACVPGDRRASVPIGRPIANTRICILDPRGEPAPIGVPGDLHIGGVQVGRGYWSRPELTAEKFIDDPFVAGGRLYRTGDLARWLAGGTIEFLGRIDHQIKLRGFRIELGEIETVLAQQEAIANAVVVARGSGSDTQLVAYAVARVDERPAVAELKSALRERLPDYMIPSAFVFLDALPLTPNGKVDRRALPAPDEAARERAEEQVAPRTETETALAAIWRDLLGVTVVGAHDDFFALGGHSLLATRLVARVRDRWHVELPLRTVFAHPTLEAMAREIDASALTAYVPIEPVERGGDLPLSFIQERLWFLDQFEPGTPSLNIPLVVRMRGALDEERLQAAVSALVARHESLRTNFVSVDGAPRAVVAADRDVKIVRVDLREVADRETAVREEVERQASRSFDVGSGPLMRVVLLRVADDERVLLVTVHHIVADGWSLVTMLDELDRLYRGAALPPPRIHYADFAAWQRERVSGELLARQLDYWKQTLAGAPPDVDLPLDFQRPPVQSYRGARLTEVFGRSLSAAVERVAKRFGATTFMALLAAFELVVSRWSGQDEVVVGAPVANRPSRELESVVGPFLNTVALRTSLASNPTFAELIGRVRETAVGAFHNADTPFEKVLEALQPPRDLSRTPIFQLFFNMLNFPLAKARLGGAELAIDSVPDPLSKFDITVYAAEHEGTIRIDFVYNADLFTESRMRELLRQFEVVLRACSAAPDQPIGDVSLVTDAARALLPDPALPLDDAWRGAVHELFADNARAHPERIAVSDRGEVWTYGELDAISSELASRLSAIAHPDDRPAVVAIYAHRSAAVVASILATLKSGAAVAMLDPANPPLRNAQCIRAVSPIASLELDEAGALPDDVAHALASAGAQRIAVPRLARGAARSASLPQRRTRPDDIACITFTSGSTGAPKAVAGMHRSLTHFTPWQCEEFGLTAGDRFTMLSGVAHDPLQRDIFTPLQIGAAISIPDPDRIGAPGYLLDWAASEEVTVAHLTPAMIQLLADSPRSVPSLRLAYVVGDVLTRDDVRRLIYVAPNVRCINFYGSTETQRAVAWHPVAADDLTPSTRGKSALPLGRGIPDVQMLVMNAAGNVCGIGEVGEVHVRSPHLAAGYLGDEKLTSERFVANRFTNAPNDRLYRTGDLARYLPDGNAEWLARADRQVKVRGFRIELGEIEAALRQHPAVREAVVVPVGDDPISRRLVAYAVPRDGAAIESDDLRALLRRQLPEPMVPSDFVVLDRIPLTPNRKIDRAALPLPATTVLADTHVPPRDVVEIELTRIWEEVLDRHPIGIRDDFFAHGGHSLLAVRLLSRIERHFGRKLPLVTFFERPTIETLAAELREHAARAPRSPLVSIQGRGDARPFFCVHPVGGTVLCYRTLSARLGDEQPFFALEAVGVDGNRPPLRSIEAMAAQYLAAVRERQPHGPYRIGGWSFGGIVAFEMAQQLRAAGEDVLTILLDTWTPGSLGDFEDAGDDATILRLLARALGDLAGREFDVATDALRSLGGRDEQLAYVVEEAHRLKALPSDVGVAQLRPLFGVVEANLEARRNYRPKNYDGPLVLFKATEALIDAPENETLGWNRFAAGGLDVHIVPGNHHTMLAPPSVDVLVDHLARYFGK